MGQFLHHVDTTQTASYNWVKLESLFGSKLKHSKIVLKQQFFLLEMRETESLGVHLNKVQSLMKQLCKLGAWVMMMQKLSYYQVLLHGKNASPRTDD